MDALSQEPVLTAGSIAGLVAAVLAAVALFGVPITEAQQKGVIAVVVLAVPIVAAIIARSKVVPQAKIDQVPAAAAALKRANAE